MDRALISEVPFDIERLVEFLMEDRARNPSNYALVTVSEGAHPKGGAIHESGEEDAYGHKKLGGIGYWVSQEIRKRSGVNIMYEQLAYIMRSGAPDSLDRMVAVSFGSLACDQVAMGHTGRMVSLQQGIYTTVPLDMVVAGQEARGRDGAVRLAELPAAGARHAGQADVLVLTALGSGLSAVLKFTVPFARPRRPGVRTWPFQGQNAGSIPAGDAMPLRSPGTPFTSSTLKRRQPLARPLLGFGNLSGRHVLGKGVPSIRVVFLFSAGRQSGREVPPHLGFHIVLWDPSPN